MRYLAIDYGLKRTGLAVCDQSEILASPLTVLNNDQNLIKKITDIVAEEKIEAIVVGLPLNMDDSKGGQAKIVADFTEKLKKSVIVPIYFQDERLSTFGAQEKLADMDIAKSKKKKLIDALAAAEILTAFLEQKKINS